MTGNTAKVLQVLLGSGASGSSGCGPRACTGEALRPASLSPPRNSELRRYSLGSRSPSRDLPRESAKLGLTRP